MFFFTVPDSSQAIASHRTTAQARGRWRCCTAARTALLIYDVGDLKNETGRPHTQIRNPTYNRGLLLAIRGSRQSAAADRVERVK
jgi:hypothetical protein